MEKSIQGAFKVNLLPQQDDAVPAGRMILDKSYEGKLEGTGKGQMISKRLENGPAAYFAIEEFEGSLDGKSGGFTLLHRGYMDAESQSLEITILKGSGSGELAGITGRMDIIQEDGKHFYELEYAV